MVSAMLTKAQVVFRRGGIGGSDVSALYDLNPFCSQVDLWVQKTREDLEQAMTRESTRLRCGSALEPFVKKELAKGDAATFVAHTDGVTCKEALDLIEQVTTNGVRFGKGQEMIASDMWPHMRANTDGVHRKTGGILEIKTVNGLTHRKSWCDGPPLYIQLQCTLYMAVTGAPFALVAALVDMSRIHLYVVERDEQLIESMGVRIESWWATHVEGGVMPETDHSASCENALRVLYPEPDALEGVMLSEAGAAAANELQALRTQEKTIAQRIKGCKNTLTAELGTAGVGLIEGSELAVYRKKNKKGAISLSIAKAPQKED